MSKYDRRIVGKDGKITTIDVYDVIDAWGVKCPALQHLIKKALQCGDRGHKDEKQDLQDIYASSVRALELYGARVLIETIDSPTQGDE